MIYLFLIIGLFYFLIWVIELTVERLILVWLMKFRAVRNFVVIVLLLLVIAYFLDEELTIQLIHLVAKMFMVIIKIVFKTLNGVVQQL